MKKILSVLVFCTLLCLAICTPAAAWSETPLLADGADVLTSGEESALLSKLEDLSRELGMDIVIVTVESLDGELPEDLADDFYDYNGYSNDGVLLLICPESGDGHISTSGYGITAITDAGRDHIIDDISDDLTNGDYYSAFTSFAENCEELTVKAKEGDAFDSDDLPKEPFNAFSALLGSVIGGFIIALIVTGIMRGQLKSVHSRNSAEEYVRRSTMNVTHSRDIFLYSHVSRTAKPKNSGGGGSSTHRSSSGRSHGGGSFKF